MDRDETYSHISVSGGDDEEVVIQTGVRRDIVDQPERSDEDDLEAAVDASVVSDDDVEIAVEEPAASVRSEPRYQETTKEDLDSVGPMSKMQKAVIAGLVLFAIGFVLANMFLR